MTDEVEEDGMENDAVRRVRSMRQIANDFMQARLPMAVSSYQIRCVAEEIALAIEAQTIPPKQDRDYHDKS